jgi:hypothetical protein
MSLHGSGHHSSDRIREADRQVEKMHRRPTHNKDEVGRGHQVCREFSVCSCGEDVVLYVYITTSRTNHRQQAWIAPSSNQHHPRVLLMTTPFRPSRRRSRSKRAQNPSTRAWHR